MKLIHLSDLHIGKRVNEYSMLEDQKYILKKILHIIDEEEPQGVIIAGDVYDKSIPAGEAVEVLDDFLVSLASRRLQVYIISGNHDSPERLSFGSRLIDASGIHLSPVYNGTVLPMKLEDEFGEVNIYMLPFIKPTNVRLAFPEEEIASYTDALKVAVSRMNADYSARNVLIAHQFVTGAERSDSEDASVGGLDNVDGSVFAGFDYVALGHIHRPQNISGLANIRYCGTPLKYSFSEVKHEKSVTVVELAEKGSVKVRTVPLQPKHDWQEIRGTFTELTDKEFYEKGSLTTDYVRIILTDEDEIPNAAMKLRAIYENFMQMEYDNTRTRQFAEIKGAEAVESKTPLQLFAELYKLQNGRELSDVQEEYLSRLIEKIREEDK